VAEQLRHRPWRVLHRGRRSSRLADLVGLIDTKFNALKYAVGQFALRANTFPLSIFTAPEYALAAPDKGRALPAEPLPVVSVSRYFTAMEKLSATHPRILIVPSAAA
jgi:predicted deacetylase